MRLTHQSKMLWSGLLGIREKHFVTIEMLHHDRSVKASDKINDMCLRIVTSLYKAWFP